MIGLAISTGDVPPIIVGCVLVGIGMLALGSKLKDADYIGVVYAPFYILGIVCIFVLPIIVCFNVG